MQYGIFLTDWRDDPRLDVGTIAVLAVLSTYRGRDGTCWPGQATIATKLKRSRPWVNAQIRKLVEFGILASERRRHQNQGEKTCLYCFCDPLTDTVRPQVDTNTTRTNIKSTRSAVQPESVQEIRVATEVPADWMPTRDDLTWLRTERPALTDSGIIGKATHRFVLSARAHGKRFCCIGSAWRCWMLDERLPAPRKPPPTKPTDLKARNEAAAEAALERIMARRNPAPS